MIVDLPNIQVGSSVEVLEQSLTAGLVEVELPTTGVLPTLVSSSSSSERLDYSGDDDVDWDNVYSASDTSKSLTWLKRISMSRRLQRIHQM